MTCDTNSDGVYRVEFDLCATGAQIRKRRKAMHLSLMRMVNRLDLMGYEISVNSLGAWERGEVTLSYDHLLMLAHFFGCATDELISRRWRAIDDDRDQPVPFWCKRSPKGWHTPSAENVLFPETEMVSQNLYSLR